MLFLFSVSAGYAQRDSARFYLHSVGLFAGSTDARVISKNPSAYDDLFGSFLLYNRPKPGFRTTPLEWPSRLSIQGEAEFRMTGKTRSRFSLGFSYFGTGSATLRMRHDTIMNIGYMTDSTGFTFEGDSAVYETCLFEWKHQSGAINAAFRYTLMDVNSFIVYSGGTLQLGAHFAGNRSATYNVITERTYRPIPVDSLNYLPPGYYYHTEKSETRKITAGPAGFVRAGIPVGLEGNFRLGKRQLGWHIEMAVGLEFTAGVPLQPMTSVYHQSQVGLRYILNGSETRRTD